MAASGPGRSASAGCPRPPARRRPATARCTPRTSRGAGAGRARRAAPLLEGYTLSFYTAIDCHSVGIYILTLLLLLSK
jgi:hypothetical protein